MKPKEKKLAPTIYYYLSCQIIFFGNFMRAKFGRPSAPPPSYQFCTWILNASHVAVAPGPLACPSLGAQPLACSSRSARPRSVLT